MLKHLLVLPKLIKQSQISWELNQQKIGKTFRCLFDRKDGAYFYGRTEYDSPDVDNDVLVDAREHYIKIGEFVDITIHYAGDYDLYGTPTKKAAKPLSLNQKRKA